MNNLEFNEVALPEDSRIASILQERYGFEQELIATTKQLKY